MLAAGVREQEVARPSQTTTTNTASATARPRSTTNGIRLGRRLRLVWLRNAVVRVDQELRPTRGRSLPRSRESFQPNANGEVDLKKDSDAMDALANAAPDEIKGDFKTFADAFKKFAKAYGDVEDQARRDTDRRANREARRPPARSFRHPRSRRRHEHLAARGADRTAGHFLDEAPDRLLETCGQLLRQARTPSCPNRRAC